MVAALFGACGGGDDCGEPRGVATFLARNFDSVIDGAQCRQTDPTLCEDYSTESITGLDSVIASLGEGGTGMAARSESGTSCEPTYTHAEAGGSVVAATAINTGDGWNVEARVDRADGNVCCYLGRLE